MTAIHSRRSIITGLAAAPVLSIPAVALDHPDAELLRAGAEFDRAVKLFADAKVRSIPNLEAWERELARLRQEAGDNHIPDAVYMSAWERADREYPVAFPTCDDVANMMDVPFRVIVTTPAKTPEGVAVKARLIRWYYSELWQKPAEDNDVDQQAVRALVEAVEALALQS